MYSSKYAFFFLHIHHLYIHSLQVVDSPYSLLLINSLTFPPSFILHFAVSFSLHIIHHCSHLLLLSALHPSFYRSLMHSLLFPFSFSIHNPSIYSSSLLRSSVSHYNYTIHSIPLSPIISFDLLHFSSQ